MELKHETIQEVHCVDYGDFDEFINRIYNVKDYSIITNEELNNDSHKLFHVVKEKLEDWDKETLERFIKGEDPSWVTQILLQDLCNRDLIEPGRYLIEVCW